MQTKEYYTRALEKSAWGPGPWQNEPDKIQWLDKATGYPCLIVRNRYGALCGYVGVNSTHPYYEKDYRDVTKNLKVHGGVNFSDFCQPASEEEGICHKVEPGEDDKIYWLGFHCGHALDFEPGKGAIFNRNTLSPEDLQLMMLKFRDEIYRDVDYVKKQVAYLAKQLKKIEKNSVVTSEKTI